MALVFIYPVLSYHRRGRHFAEEETAVRRGPVAGLSSSSWRVSTQVCCQPGFVKSGQVEFGVWEPLVPVVMGQTLWVLRKLWLRC